MSRLRYLILALLLATLLLAVIAIAPSPVALALTIGAAHELQLDRWPASGGVRVMIWRQELRAFQQARLVVAIVPAWPLLVLPVGALCLVWRRREEVEKIRTGLLFHD